MLRPYLDAGQTRLAERLVDGIHVLVAVLVVHRPQVGKDNVVKDGLLDAPEKDLQRGGVGAG